MGGEEDTSLSLTPHFTPFPLLWILFFTKTCTPIHTQLPLSHAAHLCLERKVGQVSFCGAPWLQGPDPQRRAGRPEIDLISLTGTWILPVKVGPAGFLLICRRYRSIQSARLPNPFRRPGCILLRCYPAVILQKGQVFFFL